MGRVEYFVVALIMIAMAIKTGNALTCTEPAIKVTVKIPDPAQFDEYEQYLFQGVLAYSVRKYCGITEPNNAACTNAVKATDTTNVAIYNQTDRFAMCVGVEGCTAPFLEKVIKETKPRFNGALILTDNTLVVDGIPIILQEPANPDFPTWLIPYIVFMSLVVIAAIAIIGYTVYQSKKVRKTVPVEDNQSLTASIYENPDKEPTFTMM